MSETAGQDRSPRTTAGIQWNLDACGVAKSGASIPALVHPDYFDPSYDGMRVVLVGGISGREEDVEAARQAAALFPSIAREIGLDVAINVIPVANPDATSEDAGSDPRDPSIVETGYPPEDGYFNDPDNPEARYLWRWITFAAPDILLEVEDGDRTTWEVNDSAGEFGMALGAGPAGGENSLVTAIGRGEPGGLAPVPGLRLRVSGEELEGELKRLAEAVQSTSIVSAARAELNARRNRSPLEIARVLGQTYGYVLDPVIYTQGVAISGRLRLAELDGNLDSVSAEVTGLLDQYLSGKQAAFDDSPGGQHLAGLAWCDELAAATGDPRPREMLLEAADRYHPAGPGVPPPPSDDNFRTEDMFFTSAVLGRAFASSENSDYIDMAARFLVDTDTQKNDGLFMHCQEADWNWGRSNGFAALGFAELLSYMPEDHALRSQILGAHIRHLEAMLPLQQPDGTWLQVLDYPGSYHEMSVTCMVGYAIARGLRSGWLDERFRTALDAAWRAASERIDNDGGLVDVCTGTSVQTSTREYLDRGAEFGFDHRGGSMALWFAVEVERLRRDEPGGA